MEVIEGGDWPKMERAAENPHITQSSEYLKMFSEVFGLKTYQFTLVKDKEEIGFMGGWGLKQRFLPSLFESGGLGGGGPVFIKGLSESERQEGFQLLVEKMKSIASEYDKVFIGINTDIPVKWPYARYTPIIELEGLEERMNQRMRRYIRSLEKTLRVEEKFDWPMYREMQLDFCRERGLDLNRVNTLEQMAGIQEILGSKMKMFIVYESERVVAANICFYEFPNAFHKSIRVTPRGKEIRASYFLMWHMMQEAKGRGFTRFNLMGRGSEGIETFKMRWGAELTPVHIYNKENLKFRIFRKFVRTDLPQVLFT
jgi:hypothetical protein